jgi:hypothetical protein
MTLTDTRDPAATEPSASEESSQVGSGPAIETEAPAPPASEGIATPTAPAAEPPDPYRLPEDLDPAKLLESNPGLRRFIDSKAGEVGDRLSKKREAELERTIRERIEAERHQAYLDSLVDQDDLVGLGEIAKRQRLAERQAREQSHASTQVARHAEATLGQAVVSAFQTLPQHLQTILYNEDGVTFRRWAPGGSTADGIAELIRAAIDRGVEAGLRAKYPGLKADLAEAIQREKNGEALAEEPSPDTRNGAAISRVVTDRDIGRMTLPEYEALFDEKGRPRDGVDYRPQGRR